MTITIEPDPTGGYALTIHHAGQEPRVEHYSERDDAWARARACAMRTDCELRGSARPVSLQVASDVAGMLEAS